VSLPAWIERDSLRATFCMRTHSEKAHTWLYLVDPAGHTVDLDSLGKGHIVGDGYEIAIVERPEPGEWQMVLTLPERAAPTRFAAVVGSENPRLQVFGDATKQNPVGAPVRLCASARWTHELSGLRVTASLVGPGGQHHAVELHDSTIDPLRRGLYEGIFVPPVPGRYQGSIRIENLGDATQALRGVDLSRASDGEPVDFPTASDAPRFVRQVSIYFDSGPRPEPKDEEPGLNARRSRVAAADRQSGGKAARRQSPHLRSVQR
jgi:hypothetical protein